MEIYLSGEERLEGGGSAVNGVRISDFWRWAFSDLRMNDVRGVFCEWMVAKLIGIEPPPRDSWDS